MRIVVADDEALTRMGLRVILQDMEHEVVGAAADGVAALDLVCEKRPDIAILDIMMPRMDGLAVAEAIMQRCPLPIIMLSAYSERDLVQQAASTAGIQAYLVKPVREAELAPTIELAVARFDEWQTLQAEATSRQEALESRKDIARAKGLLIRTHSLAEREAFLEIQHRARRQRLSMRQVALEIIRELSLDLT